MYVIPAINMLNIIPSELKSFVENNKKYYIDLDIIIKNITANIDCVGIPFITKCNPKFMIDIDDTSFISTIRQIKLLPNTSVLTGKIP